jgi:hypothetical protein
MPLIRKLIPVSKAFCAISGVIGTGCWIISLCMFKLILLNSAFYSISAAYFDEGTRRSLQFWWYITPIYAHYRFYQILNRELGIITDDSASAAYNEL